MTCETVIALQNFYLCNWLETHLLNQHLADVLDLGLQAKQAHWNVKGPHFIALYELFDKVAEELGSSPTITGKMGDADTADLFTEASRGADKPLWLIEAHASENLFPHTMKPLDSP